MLWSAGMHLAFKVLIINVLTLSCLTFMFVNPIKTVERGSIRLKLTVVEKNYLLPGEEKKLPIFSRPQLSTGIIIAVGSWGCEKRQSFNSPCSRKTHLTKHNKTSYYIFLSNQRHTKQSMELHRINWSNWYSK